VYLDGVILKRSWADEVKNISVPNGKVAEVARMLKAIVAGQRRARAKRSWRGGRS